jgi:TM2 domain-containing membrane protein YozV
MATTQEPQPRSFVTAIILSVLLGHLGVDRFYLRHYGVGIAKLASTVLTLGIVGTVWWAVDIVLIATRKVNNVTWQD